MEKLKTLPDGCVDLVLCDPPYGTIKGMKYNGMATHWDDALDPAAIFKELNRVTRMNGAIVLFSQEPYTSRLINEAHGNLPFSYRMVWLKDHFGNALAAKKAPVSFYEDILVFFKKYETQALHPLRDYVKQLFSFIGKDKRTLFSEMGHQGVCHFLRYETTQFNLCTARTYKQLCDLYGIDKEEWFKPFSELEAINKQFKDSFKRCFNLPEGQKYKSNVLQYKKDYDGFHPTQKPVALMEDLVRTYSNPGNLVLDFTMGSGSTGVACVNTSRSFIGIERDPGYFNVATSRIKQAQGCE